MKKLRQWFSVNSAKNPNLVVLLLILLSSSLVFVFATAAIIWTVPNPVEDQGLLSRVFYLVTVIRDSGSLQYVIDEISNANVVLILICLLTDFVSMIVFTGAVIGYVTSIISQFIEEADSDSKVLSLNNHIIVLNWNNRGCEIISDFLFKNKKTIIVVMQSGEKEDVKQEITEHLADSLRRANSEMKASCGTLGFWERRRYVKE